MATVYKKPSLTNLPPDLGKSIFEQILNSKPMSDDERRRITNEEISRIIEAEKKNGRRNTTGK